MNKIIILLSICIFSLPSLAKEINIDSNKQLEWYRDEQKIVAIGNAVATQENTILKGDKITAFYEKVQLEDGSQKTQIQKIFSDGSVIITTPDTIGKGTHFEYNLPSKKAILKGHPDELENEQGNLTATDSITYYGAENKSIALGNVIAKNANYTIYAEKMISYFDNDNNGNKKLKHIEIYAHNNPVKIVNQQATVTGRKGIYFPLENKLKLFENVVINQNGDILKGDYAETDFKTGISSLRSSQNKGRVSGIFHNKKKK